MTKEARCSQTRSFKMQYEGIVVGLDEVEDNEDEARCLIWFYGEGEDSTQIKITVPAGSLQLRQDLLVTIELPPYKERERTK